MTDNNLPLVSIITPAYNQAEYLIETIESILNQDYPNIEYIVLNDGSSDETEAILRQYTGRIIWETQENMGEPRTVNKGYGMATGEYVMAINADDPARPGLISRLVQYMESHPNALAVYPNWVVIDENSNDVKNHKTWEADYEKMVRYAVCVPGPATLIHRRGLEIVQGRDIKYRYVSDMDFWFRLGLYGEIAHIPEHLTSFRVHSQARGVAKKAEVGLEIITMVEDFFARADLPPNIQRLHNAAMSSAHYEAAVRMPTYLQMRQHFMQSFALHPQGWFNLKHRPLWGFLVLITPEPVRKFFWVLRNPRRYIALKRGNSPEAI